MKEGQSGTASAPFFQKPPSEACSESEKPNPARPFNLAAESRPQKTNCLAASTDQLSRKGTHVCRAQRGATISENDRAGARLYAKKRSRERKVKASFKMLSTSGDLLPGHGEGLPPAIGIVGLIYEWLTREKLRGRNLIAGGERGFGYKKEYDCAAGRETSP